MMMFQTRVFLGGADIDDRYEDLRLDVDNMSYEVFTILSTKFMLSDSCMASTIQFMLSDNPFPIFQQELLELSERIGYVSTGLREEEILRNLRKPKHSFFGASPSQKEWKCIICQVSSSGLLSTSLFHWSFDIFVHWSQQQAITKTSDIVLHVIGRIWSEWWYGKVGVWSQLPYTLHQAMASPEERLPCLQDCHGCKLVLVATVRRSKASISQSFCI